jgi:hypothetical protein
MHPAPLLPALAAALIAACDGAPVEPAGPVQVASVDTLRPGQVAHVRGSGLTSLRSLLLDGVPATELVARSDSVAEFRVPSMRAVRDRHARGDGVGRMDRRRSAPSYASRRASRCARPSHASSRRTTCAVCASGGRRGLRAERRQPGDPDGGDGVQRTLVSVRLLGTVTPRPRRSHRPTHADRSHPSPHAVPDDAVEPCDARTSRADGQLLAGAGTLRPALRDAVAGDTLRFVDWFSGTPGICHQPASRCPASRRRSSPVSGPGRRRRRSAAPAGARRTSTRRSSAGCAMRRR